MTPITPDIPMGRLEAEVPAARRALFRAYHIGGCSSCGFRPEETLAEVCARQEEPIDPLTALALIERAREEEAALQISPLDLQALLSAEPGVCLVDIRSREEHEAVSIPGSKLLTQELTQELLHGGHSSAPVVFYDHSGQHIMDAVSYFIGHGLNAARGLKGGIDAWAVEVDPDMPRYRLE